MFARAQTSPWAASAQIALTFSCSMPMMADIAPTPTGTASCIYFPRLRTVRTASANRSVPAATCAEYSPRLCPATKVGFSPFAQHVRAAATETVRMVGWVISVRAEADPLTFAAQLRQLVSQSFGRLPQKSGGQPDISPPTLFPCPPPASPGREI